MANPTLDLFNNNNVAVTANLSSHAGQAILKGGMITILLWGSFNGATVTIEMSPDDGTTWIPAHRIDGNLSSMSNARIVNVPISHRMSGLRIRGILESAGASTSLHCEMR